MLKGPEVNNEKCHVNPEVVMACKVSSGYF